MALFRIRALVLIGLCFVTACSGPTSPTGQIPNVAGTYSGQLEWLVDGVLVTTLQARLTVVQSGSQLTITGSEAPGPALRP